MTVLFADIVGSTTLTVGSDPEVVRERLAGLFERSRVILLRHGATVEKFIGDAVMAVFGVPTTHEDDAERAIRAALELAAAFGAIAAGPIERVEVRIGINTGEVVTGSGAGEQFLVTGEGVNQAARLQTAAAPGEILAGGLTRRLAGGLVRFGASRRIQAKGIGLIEAWPVEGLVAAAPAGLRAAEPDAAFIGRERELELLAMLWSHAVASGRPALVTLIGAAGIGKSRLVGEFLASLTEARIIRTRCPPYGDGLALWPIEQILGDAGRDLRSDLVTAFRRHVELLARDGPVALLVEDIHWAEPPLLDALEQVLDRGHGPIFLLCAARGDLFTTRAAWGGGRANAASVSLGPLSDASVGRLVGPSAGAAALAFILTHAEGNPLFVHEYLRAVADGDDSALTGTLPPTLRALIAARLDRVPGRVRELIRLASVVGRTFHRDDLVALGAGGDWLPMALEAAEELEIIQPAEAAPAEGGSYSFLHVLFRDVAYAGAPKGDRARQHEALSRWIEGGSRPDLALAAYHADQAQRLAADLRSDDRGRLAVRAFDLLRRAAEERRARTDSHAALALYRQAQALAVAAGVDERIALEVRARAAIARVRIDGSADAIAEIDGLLADARRSAPPDLLVQLLVLRSTISVLDDLEEAGRSVAEAIAVAEQAHDVARSTYARWAAAELLAAAGDLEGQRRTLETARAEMLATGATFWLVPCLVDLAENALAMGDHATAEVNAREALVASEPGPSAISRFRALEIASRVRLAAGDLAAAGRYADAATVLARDIGEPWAAARAALAAAAYRKATGDAGAARRLLEAALQEAERAARPTMRGVVTELRAILAALLASIGDRSAAEALLDVAEAEAPRADVRARRHIESARQAVASGPADPLRA